MILRATVVFSVAIVLASATAHATMLNPTGAVSIVTPPSNVSTGALESNTTILAFAERQGVALPADVVANITVPGTSPSGETKHLSPGTIATGTTVNSYFIHFDVVGAPTINNAIAASGSVSFDSDVLGLLVLNAQLNATHAILGLAGTTYSTAGQLEIVAGGVGTGTNDQITLSADRRTVSFNLRDANFPDEIRVITSVPEPSAFGLAAMAALGLLVARFRRSYR